MMVVEGGWLSECPKCKKNIHNFPICGNCGTNYEVYKDNEMTENLKRFGFEEVIEYYPQTFFERLFKEPKKIKDSYLKWGKIIAREYMGSRSNRTMYFEDKPIGIFNNYGDYEDVSISLRHLLWEYIQENELYIKSQKREKLINEIL